MSRQLGLLLLGFVAGVICTLLVAGPVAGGARNCRPAWKCGPAPTVLASSAPTIRPATPPPTTRPTAAASSPAYTFVEDFSGSSIDPVWSRHYSCCGTLAGFDPALASVADGFLTISAERRSSGWFSYLLDTKTTWSQRYGYFEARIRSPKGAGLWPAFWGYHDASGAELDTMEICANPIGANAGNDASLLHTHVHWSGSGDAGKATRSIDLSQGFHVYAHDWRADHVAFFLDGLEVWRFTDAAHIPTVALPLIVNLGVGGSWCGSADASTPSPAALVVDWIRVRA